MTYPFGASKTILEKAFALPSEPSAPESERSLDTGTPDQSDWAVALFEHPEH